MPVLAASGQSVFSLPPEARLHQRYSWNIRATLRKPWRRRGRCPAWGSRLRKRDSTSHPIWREPEAPFLQWASYCREFPPCPRYRGRNTGYPDQSPWTFPYSDLRSDRDSGYFQSQSLPEARSRPFSGSYSPRDTRRHTVRPRLQWQGTFLHLSQTHHRWPWFRFPPQTAQSRIHLYIRPSYRQTARRSGRQSTGSRWKSPRRPQSPGRPRPESPFWCARRGCFSMRTPRLSRKRAISPAQNS